MLTELIGSAVRTLPLYDLAPPDADGWHAVRSPGGYEWWHFDAEDDSGQIRFVAGLGEGFMFHPGYLRRYYQYLAEPTRHVPPLPGEYPCVWFTAFEGGRVLGEYQAQVRPEEFAASAAGPEVRVGPNRLSRHADGSLRLQLSNGPLSGELTFHPQLIEPPRNAGEVHDALFPSPGTPGEGQGEGLSSSRDKPDGTPNAPHPNPLPEYREREKSAVARENGLQTTGSNTTSAVWERDFLSRIMTGADHRWIIANPLCRVEGDIHLRGRLIRFTGRGYHDHHFGSAPLGPGLRRWIRGRVLWDDGMFAFHYARPRRRRLGDELSFVQGDASGIRQVPVKLTRSNWSGRTALVVRYPTRLHFKTVDAAPVEVILESPRVIHATHYQLLLTYDAQFGKRMGKALCEVGYPRRLTWPLVGTMIENAIEGPK